MEQVSSDGLSCDYQRRYLEVHHMISATNFLGVQEVERITLNSYSFTWRSTINAAVK
jgi:hypothetical protein